MCVKCRKDVMEPIEFQKVYYVIDIDYFRSKHRTMHTLNFLHSVHDESIRVAKKFEMEIEGLIYSSTYRTATFNFQPAGEDNVSDSEKKLR